jgi:hypothetical protein
MQPKHELADKPPPEAFGKIWELLPAFNERIVGDASARTLAILLREPATGWSRNVKSSNLQSPPLRSKNSSRMHVRISIWPSRGTGKAPASAAA